MWAAGRRRSILDELRHRRLAGAFFPHGVPLDLTPGWITPAAPAPHAPGEKRRASRHRRGIAVLPFSNMGRDPMDEYFSEGFAEDVLMHLSCCPTLHVISRSSACAYENGTPSVGRIAEELGVGTVLLGSVRRSGRRVHITARLIDGASQGCFWSETFRRPLDQVFTVQREVVEGVAQALEVELPPRVRQRLQSPPTHDLRAYELFLQGRQDVYRNRAPDLREGIRKLERAVQLDPGFGAAHAMIAIAHLASPCWAGAPSRMALPLARDAARRALELDDSQGLAWVAQAGVKYHYEWDWAGAEEDLARAQGLDPNLPDLHLWCGLLLILLERWDEAAAWLDRGLSIDPRSSLMAGLLGFARHLGGHREEGLEILRAAAARDPGSFDLEHIRGWCLMEEQRFLEAAEAFGAGGHLTGGHPYLLAARAVALHHGGLEEQAAGLVSAIRELTPKRHVTPMLSAYLALVDGDPDAVVAHLWTAAEERSHTVLWFRAVRLFRHALAGHPRWRALLHRIWPADFPDPAVRLDRPHSHSQAPLGGGG
jgi:TolB-like protein